MDRVHPVDRVYLLRWSNQCILCLVDVAVSAGSRCCGPGDDKGNYVQGTRASSPQPTQMYCNLYAIPLSDVVFVVATELVAANSWLMCELVLQDMGQAWWGIRQIVSSLWWRQNLSGWKRKVQLCPILNEKPRNWCYFVKTVHKSWTVEIKNLDPALLAMIGF